jgi:hypothetical protein
MTDLFTPDALNGPRVHPYDIAHPLTFAAVMVVNRYRQTIATETEAELVIEAATVNVSELWLALALEDSVLDLLDLTLTACIQHQLFLHGQLSDIQTAQINQLIEDLNRAATAAN